MALTLNTTSMLYKPSGSTEWSPITITTDMNVDLIYPIGSVYLSVSSTSPASLFGGTWEQIKDQFLLAAGDTYNAGTTGGSATINLQHYHTTSAHTLTTSEIPAHQHKEHNNLVGWRNSSSETIGDLFQYATAPKSFNTNDKNKYYTDSAGSGGSHSHGNTGNALSASQSILPPYLAVYMWKRIA